jgi:hypothetical protein
MLYKFIKIDCESLSILLPPHSSLTMTSIQDTSNAATAASTHAATATNVVYGIWVTLTDDDEKLTFDTTYFLNVADAYECYKEMMCELGKNFAVLELVELKDSDIARVLDSVTSGGSEMKSLEAILKDLETSMTDSERENMLVRERTNDLNFAVPSPAIEEKRKRLTKALMGIVIAAEGKRLREQYDSDDTCDDSGDSDDTDDCDEDECTCYAPVVPVSQPEPEYNNIQFVNLVYDVRRMPDEVFDLFFEEMLKEQANREGYKKACEASQSTM